VTNFSYLSTTYDERLQEINNLNPGSAVPSQFNYRPSDHRADLPDPREGGGLTETNKTRY
jgi:hypothetical protein